MSSTQNIRPQINTIAVTPGPLKNTVSWSTPENAYGDCPIALTRLPPFELAPLIEETQTSYVDEDVIPNEPYLYTISCMDSRGLQSLPIGEWGAPLEEEEEEEPTTSQIRYVSPTGGGDGTSAQTPMTAAQALSVVNPGSFIIFLPGVYNAQVPVLNATAIINVTRSGTPSARITLSAQAGVIVENPGGYGIYCKNVSDVVIEGFEVRNCALKGIAARESSPTAPMTGNIIRECHVHDTMQEGIYLSQWSNGVIENCRVNNVGLSGVETTGHGIYLANAGSKNVVFRSLEIDLPLASIGAAIHMNGDTSSSAGTDGLISGILIDSCRLFGGIKGVSGDGVTDSEIVNCIIDIRRNGDRFGHGIRLYQADGANGPKNMKIYNNTIRAGTGGSASAIRLTAEPASQLAIFNNLTVSPDQWYFTGPSAANLNGANFDTVTYQPNAAAKNGGVDSLNGVSAPEHDFLGYPRSTPITIGAIE